MYFRMSLGLGFMLGLGIIVVILWYGRVWFHENDINLSKHKLYKFN